MFFLETDPTYSTKMAESSETIDHAFINQAWSSSFSDSYADFLDPSQSDHTPCLFRMPSTRRFVIKPFKFFQHVIDHPEYAETVSEAWNTGQITGTDQFKLVRSLKLLKRPLRKLNKRHFSGISQRVKAQKEKVEELQRSLLTSPDVTTAREEHTERDNLNILLKAEEKFYKQKSRVRWADVGDRNTPFYHRTVSSHASRNHIHYLKNAADHCFFAVDEIKAHAADYFQGILGSTDLPSSPVSMDDLQSLLPFRCTELQQRYLKRDVSAAEIKATLFAMPLNKSPGPDGYSVEFFRASWDTVGQDITKAVREFFKNGKLLKDMNTTAIALIPKSPDACSLTDYRPISCCNIVYKLISKIIANRLKPILTECVSPNQAAFLKGRSLGENVLLATELIKDYNKSSCLKSAMLKIDIRKAFDTVCWDFVIKILEAQQFPPMFITWIKECISSPRFSVAINGELAGFFEGKKGLRQGDSISPYLFIMLMEVLSRLLDKAESVGSFRLHPLCSSPKITHLLFADDLLVFSDGSRASTAGIKSVMNQFKEWSGLDTNESKTEIFYGGYSNTQATVLSDLSGFRRGEFPTRYLGLPLSPKRISAATLQPFVDRITSKLHSWTVKFLSFAGKVTMIYSVIYSMVNFWSSVFVLPKWFYSKIDSLCSGFLWKNSTVSAAGARVSWETICKPKSEGGLGFRKLEEFEMVFRLKRVWLFFYGSGSLWVPWLTSNRFGGRSFWLINDSPRFSMTVRSMLQLKDQLQNFLRCSIGNGNKALFWYDYWTDLGPLHLLFGPSGPRALRIPLHATVSQAVRNGNWILPPARSDYALTLQIVLSTVPVPIDTNAEDAYCWRNRSGGFSGSFSSKVTWERIRISAPPVQWHSVVWFKEEVPRCSFISWTAFLGRLPTRDRLISWGLNVPPGCVLCSVDDETIAHIFFRCSFAVATWSRFCGRYMASPPASLADVVVLCLQLQEVHARRAVVLKIINQAIVYCLWRERNLRIFQGVSLSQEAFFRVVDRRIRDRLLSLSPPSVTAPSPSLLELYFCFISPYRTVWTASAHIITAVIGSGVLSLAWAVAQIGWVGGPLVMILFSLVTYYTSILLCACYRSGGKRNYTYMDAIHSNLGGIKVKLCGVVQYVNLFGTAIGYTIASAISMIAIQRTSCQQSNGDKDPCHVNGNPYMIAFGAIQIIFSQIPDFDQLWWLSIVAALMSFGYSTIGLGLGISRVVDNKEIKGTLTGVTIGTVTPTEKVWRTFQSLGNIAFAYSYSMILIEIQDTLKAPPAEEETMRKATLISVAVTTLFYMLCGCVGYAAFGDSAPGNLLAAGGFRNPYWLLDIANLAIVIHLVGAYQVYCQPLFAFVEKEASKRFPESKFITKETKILHIFPGSKPFNLNLFRLAWRTVFVITTTLISMIMPFFNDVLGLLGAIGFWPLTVYFPVEMYIVQKNVPRWSTRWVCLQVLSLACLVVSVAAAAGSIVGIVTDLKSYKPFKTDF